MLTARGFWFFVTVVASLIGATLFGSSRLMLVCVTLLFWFLCQWFLFQLRLCVTARSLQVTRALETARGQVESIWARQKVEVTVTIRSDSWLELPYAMILDRLPASAQLQDGMLYKDGALGQEKTLELRYHIECRSPGRLRFEGVKLELADLQGFFSCRLFLRDPREFRVLPALAVERAHTSFVKRHNVLPLLGSHRHPRPGTSSELLDLRDYIPGDPPKMIAWKVSARRDRLITRELESEVPIRCTLFIDMSNSVRVGPAGETALGRLVEIAAGIAQANLAERDLTGICLFDETGVRDTIRAGRGPKHLLKLIDVLTEVAGLAPRTSHAKLRDLLPLGYGLVQDVYPEWLDRDVNYTPGWLPIWAAQPYYTIPQPPIPSGPWWLAPWIWLRRRLRHSMFTMHNRRRWRFSFAYQREYRWRKELAAVLAVQYRLGPGGLAMLLEDDEQCATYLQRFLADHQVAYPYPLYDDDGRYLFAAPQKPAVLARALLQAIAHGKDNELFVLCVDLLEASPALGELERAVCVAKARHHQVIVICPWPAAVAPPHGKPKPTQTGIGPALRDLHRLLLRTSTLRLHRAYDQMQRAFGKVGVPVICAAQGDAIDLILHRMRRLRIQERGVR